jgi:hypothetical protein
MRYDGGGSRASQAPSNVDQFLRIHAQIITAPGDVSIGPNEDQAPLVELCDFRVTDVEQRQRYAARRSGGLERSRFRHFLAARPDQHEP